MTKQTLSIEQMQHLQELGLDTSKASMCWIKTPNGRDLTFNDEWVNFEESILDPVLAYTLQDVLDALPKDISKDGCTWYASLYIDFENNRIAYGNTDRYGFEVYHEIMIEKDLIDAAYSMLCWAIDNKFVETNKNE